LLTLHAPDLTIVEEMDTQIDLQAAPATPTHTQLEQSIAYRSPGAASEMSGTTAISSFTMIEAEFLEPKYILKHMRKLCDSSREFLDHLAPENGGIDADLRNIQEMQKPESDFNDEYRDFDDELNVHLKHYKSEEHSYIHVRAIHRALFDGNYDAAATQTGIDLILYLANLLIFAKQMIHSDRTEKGIWDALRQLDNVFPSQFMRSLEPETKPTIAGESTMLQETFELALELRTQLAILVLERSALDSSFNPDEAIQEVFFQSESSQEMGSSIIRGWNVEALGGEDFALPKRFENIVIERLHKIRESFLLDDESLPRGDLVNTEKLNASFLWTPTIMRLLSWVRLRHKELSTTIDDLGGAAAILRNVKQELREPQTITKQTVVKSAQLGSPRKKRRSFGRDRRRSSRKFDPNAAVDLHAIDALKARERLSGASTAVHTQEDFSTQYVAEEEQGELPIINEQQDQSQPVLEVEEERRVEQVEVTVEEQARGEAVEGEAEEQILSLQDHHQVRLIFLKHSKRPRSLERRTALRYSSGKVAPSALNLETASIPSPHQALQTETRASSAHNLRLTGSDHDQSKTSPSQKRMRSKLKTGRRGYMSVAKKPQLRRKFALTQPRLPHPRVISLRRCERWTTTTSLDPIKRNPYLKMKLPI
jgi:hypothetical protein